MRTTIAFLLALLLPISSAWAEQPKTAAPQTQAVATKPPGAAIASGHKLATEAGLEILRAGGNAFDAAVAVSSTLSVVEPISSGLGGGGLFLLHDAKTGQDLFLDARETSPASATPDKYLDKAGNLDEEKSQNGPWSAGIPGLLPHAQAGKIKIVAVGSAQRLPILPDVPTVAEQGYPGFESSQWFGLLAPAGTPQEAISRLQAAAQRALRTDAVRQRLAHDAAEPSGAGPAEFAAFIDAEERRWSQVVKDARLSAE